MGVVTRKIQDRGESTFIKRLPHYLGKYLAVGLEFRCGQGQVSLCENVLVAAQLFPVCSQGLVENCRKIQTEARKGWEYR